MRHTLLDAVEEGDRVAARITWEGTHRGVWRGIAPTGKRIKGKSIRIIRFTGGKMAEQRVVTDRIGLMQQLGVIPAPPQPAIQPEAPPVDSGRGGGTSPEQNKAMVRHLFEEAFNKKESRIIGELVAANYVNHDIPMPVPGLEGFRQFHSMFLAAFPDIRVIIEDEVAEGDKVSTRGYLTGTHQGNFQGIPATGKHVTVQYADIWRVAGGKLLENWVRMDQMGLMQQLGVIPAQG